MSLSTPEVVVFETEVDCAFEEDWEVTRFPDSLEVFLVRLEEVFSSSSSSDVLLETEFFLTYYFYF